MDDTARLTETVSKAVAISGASAAAADAAFSSVWAGISKWNIAR